MSNGYQKFFTQKENPPPMSTNEFLLVALERAVVIAAHLPESRVGDGVVAHAAIVVGLLEIFDRLTFALLAARTVVNQLTPVAIETLPEHQLS